MGKVKSLEEAVKLLNDGDTLSLSGNVLHRAPMAFVRQVIREGKKNLKIAKTAGAHDIDLLAATNSIDTVDAGFVSYESKYGLAQHYRKGVQEGRIKANEHACYTVVSALRGAVINAPFMPVYGLQESDLIKENDYFARVADPFTGEEVTVVQTIRPDLAVIHVQECDERGNAVIWGPNYEDVLLAKAAQKVIITTEKIVDFELETPKQIDIPGFLVDAVVHAPNGASPTSCYGLYDVDHEALDQFFALADSKQIDAFVANYADQDLALEGSKK